MDIPQLTPEQRLVIREAQYQASRLAQEAQKANAAVVQLAQKFAADLKIDVETVIFDLDSLLFSPRKAPDTN